MLDVLEIAVMLAVLLSAEHYYTLLSITCTKIGPEEDLNSYPNSK